MQKRKFSINNCRGSALVMVVVFAIIIAVSSAAVVKLLTGGNEMHYRSTEIVRSFWANEAALNIAYRYISMQGSPITKSLTGTPVMINGYQPSVVITPNGKRQYDVEAKDQVKRAPLDNITNVNGLSGINLGWWTLFEAKDMPSNLMWKQMTIQGNYHCNGTVNIASSMEPGRKVSGTFSTSSKHHEPTFATPWDYGIKITDDTPNYFDEDNSAEFFNSRIPSYKHYSDTVEYKAVLPESLPTATGGFFYSSRVDYYIAQLNGKDITIKSTSNDGASFKTEYSGVISHFNTTKGNIIKFGKEVHLKGTLDEQLTIATQSRYERDIVFAGNVLYADDNINIDPADLNPTYSDDALALVSCGDIEFRSKIGWEGENINGERGYKIHGGLYAPNGSIQVENYDNKIYGFRGLHDFEVYGNILQKESGLTWDGYRGVKETYHPDDRFTSNYVIPPGVPTAEIQAVDGPMYILRDGVWKNSVKDHTI